MADAGPTSIVRIVNEVREDELPFLDNDFSVPSIRWAYSSWMPLVQRQVAGMIQVCMRQQQRLSHHHAGTEGRTGW